MNRELADDGWYIRGITKNGRKIGTHQDREGRLHLESNSWAVLSGAADYEKGIQAMDAVDEYLYTPYELCSMARPTRFLTIVSSLSPEFIPV